MNLQKRAGWVCLAVGLLALLLRAALLPWRPIPEPTVHDEFSYLLGAETFTLGRVSNPPHPMWVHFETFHENFQPTYTSKYPPAQALFLALGWKLFGHPWYGVWLTCGLMCAALCWMLQGWLPPRYALLGGLMAVFQWALAGYWINSYWGGAVAAAAGALVIGAVPRLRRHPTPTAAALAALGIVVLANSRPYEGAFTVAAAAAALWIWRRRAHQPFRELLAFRIALPAAAILLCGLAAMLYYNYRVTGRALLMPYSLHQAQYGAAPIFWMSGLPPTPAYHHEMIGRLWTKWDKAVYDRARAAPHLVIVFFIGMLPFFLTPVSAAAAFGAVFLRSTAKVRIVLAMLAVPTFGILLERFSMPHYFAPAAGLLLLLVLLGVEFLGSRFGPRAVTVLALLFVASVVLQNAVLASDPANPFKGFSDVGAAMRDAIRIDGYSHEAFGARRRRLLDWFARQPGKHLVIVRYSARHDIMEEWVYNHADIDRAAVLWARDMGDLPNRELLAYFRDRRIWLLDPDAPSPHPVPYPLPAAS